MSFSFGYSRKSPFHRHICPTRALRSTAWEHNKNSKHGETLPKDQKRFFEPRRREPSSLEKGPFGCRTRVLHSLTLMTTPSPSTSNHHELYSRVCGFVYPRSLPTTTPIKDRECPIPHELVQRVKAGVAKHLSAHGKILNLYIWGSRFYRNASTNSDYDLVAIVTGTYRNSSVLQLDTIFLLSSFMASLWLQSLRIHRIG